MEEDTVELIDYLRVIWKRKRLIIVGTLACMAATAGVVSFMLPEVYKASVTFLLEESKIPQEKIVSQINPKILETYGKTYEGVIKNRIAMNQAIEKFQLDKEPYEFTLEDFDKVLSVEAVKKSKLLRLTVEFPNPQLARDIANFLANKAVEFNNTLNATGSAENRDFIRDQMEIAKEAMDEAESTLLKFREKAQLAVLRKKIDILLFRKGEIENGLSHTKVAVAENVECLKKIEEEFAKRDRTVKLSRRLAEDPLYQQSLAHLSESDIKRIFNLSMEVEVADPTYVHLEKKLVDVIPALGGLYAKRNSLQVEFKENTSELNRLQIELANKEIELERLQRDYNIAKGNHTMFLKKVDVIPTLSGLYAKRNSLQAELRQNTLELKALQVELVNKEMELQRLQRTYGLAVDAYKMFVKKFEEITIQVASRSQDLKVLDPAVVPDGPFTPKKKLDVLIAGIFGSMMFLFLAFFMEYLERAGRERGRAV